MMKLITENIEDIQVLTEEKDGKKNYYIEGIFLQGDLTNRNGRNYPVNILDREVTKYNENFVGTGRALGELGHPDGPTINLDRVSHKILSLKREGNNFIGKAKLLETPMGKIAKSLLDDGVKLGVSSRGLGSMTEKNGVNYVGEDFMLATAADIVADPSAPDAFVEGIMEGKEWIWESGLLKEVELNRIKKTIDESTQYDLQERKVKAFAAFLRSL
jgi:Prohead core protein serine protease